LLILILFFLAGSYTLYTEFYDKGDVLKKIANDLTLLIPIIITLFCACSIFFNLKKFEVNIKVTSKTYQLLRIGDSLFCIFLFLFSFAGFYTLVHNWYTEKIDSTFFIIRLCVISFAILFSVLLYINSNVFHKKLIKDAQKDEIDKIGV